jgi:ornithine carbamoyltransferase
VLIVGAGIWSRYFSGNIDQSIPVINLATKGNNPLVRLAGNYVLREHEPANVVAWRKILQHDA